MLYFLHFLSSHLTWPDSEWIGIIYVAYILATKRSTQILEIFMMLSVWFPLSWANETVIALSWKDLYIQSLWCYYLLLTLPEAICLFCEIAQMVSCTFQTRLIRDLKASSHFYCINHMDSWVGWGVTQFYCWLNYKVTSWLSLLKHINSISCLFSGDEFFFFYTKV